MNMNANPTFLRMLSRTAAGITISLLLCGVSVAQTPSGAPDLGVSHPHDHAETEVLFTDSMERDWEENWFLDGELGTVRHWNDGLYLAGGPITKWGERSFGIEQPTEYNAHHVVLWTRESFAGDIRVSYEFIKQPGSEGSNLLYLQAQGIGMPPYDEDIYAWRDLRREPGMNLYFQYMDLISLSLREDIRCRRYPWNDVERGVSYPGRGLFRPKVQHSGIPEGVRLHLDAEKRAESLHLILQNLETGEIFIDHTWDLTDTDDEREPALIDEGRIGIRLMGGHKILVRDFRVERL